MYLEICLIVLLLVIVIMYLYFNRSTLIPIDVKSYMNTDTDNMLHIPIIKGM